MRYLLVGATGNIGARVTWSHAIRDECVLRTSTGNGKIAFIHPDDIADVATAALITRDHDGQSWSSRAPRR